MNIETNHEIIREIDNIMINIQTEYTYEKIGPCVYNYESINDHYMYLYRELSIIMGTSIYNTEDDNTINYISSQYSDLYNLQNTSANNFSFIRFNYN